MVSVSTPDVAPEDAAARNAILFALLKVESLRASVHRMIAFGACPSPWEITCAAGAVPVVFVNEPTSNPITAALTFTPDEVHASALPAVQACVTVAAPAPVDPPLLTAACVVSSHRCVFVGADRYGEVADSVATVSSVMSPTALVIVTDGDANVPVAVV